MGYTIIHVYSIYKMADVRLVNLVSFYDVITSSADTRIISL